MEHPQTSSEKQQEEPQVAYPKLDRIDSDLKSSTVVSQNMRSSLPSIALGSMGGYASGQVVRIGSRVAFGCIAAVILAGSTFRHLNKAEKKKEEGQSTEIDQYEMLAKLGMEAANQQIQKINFRDFITNKWELIQSYTKDNYSFTSSFLVGFILAMF